MKNKTPIPQDLELQAALLERGDNPKIIESRDLKRYYALLNYHLLEITLSSSEVNLICEALKDYKIEHDSERARVIWKQIDEAIQRNQLDQKWGVDSKILIRQLQTLNHLQFIALVDSVERYWVREKVSPDESIETRLSRVGLINCCDFAL
jgi:hypothetical protein